MASEYLLCAYMCKAAEQILLRSFGIMKVKGQKQF